MPGIAVLGKLFFVIFLKRLSREKSRFFRKATGDTFHDATVWRECPPTRLVVRKIIRRKSRRGSEHLIALSENAAVASWHEFAFVRVRRDYRPAAGGQT
jgi:hypothetical protein